MSETGLHRFYTSLARGNQESRCNTCLLHTVLRIGQASSTAIVVLVRQVEFLFYIDETLKTVDYDISTVAAAVIGSLRLQTPLT